MDASEPDPVLARSWKHLRRKLLKRVPREDRDHLEALALDLIASARRHRPTGEIDSEEPTDRLAIGVETAATLARQGTTDLEVLAAAATLPWYDSGLGARPYYLNNLPPLTWPLAMTLAMARPYSPTRGDPPWLRTLNVHRLRGLPPELRTAAVVARARPSERFGDYHMRVPGLDPSLLGYVAEARGLVYLVRWDVPADAIRPVEPPINYPGDTGYRRPYAEPGWLVDRVSREVRTVELRWLHLSRLWATPLPPGWRPADRPAVVDGLAADLATLLPEPLHTALGPVMREVTERYASVLTTEAWPEFLGAWQTGRHTVGLLAGAGCADPEPLTAALLAACGTAPADTLVDDGSPLWRTPAGAQARTARPAEPETDTPEAAARAERLAAAPAPLRALVFANAWARRQAETGLFGTTPPARTRELDALAPLVRDLPAFHRFV
ncbi:hypothetical protein [Actinomadura sp. K4S16]|uniref:hypothetical protein n=1 Tax=Actinomadura sp. K4S16 TaxID=1316147 RepID=UPI0011EFC924|nr:hypothetical protein [Actinomadura sp. K4S16]